ncbi:MAG TPA: HPr(Ser) kinase/phosphatase [Verrucomicrobiota bacterium]|nr:HPr(Ser) kinase/phosphatase [Verrucomicrobiota bacterium]HNT13767.1 HPr(Ser) kinase/phosphatase [Verrucomicrobiota bacterium]
MKPEAITVERFFKENQNQLGLELVAGADGLKREIMEPTVNRPGLMLAGFTKYFAYKRVQALGNAEIFFLRSQTPADRARCYQALFGYKVPCLVCSRSLKPDEEMIAAANAAHVPIFRTPQITMHFISQATLTLETMFAPRGTELGSMVDILGIGVIIKGESGAGKSESVLALIERGYCLVADDVVKVHLQDGQHVIGTAAALTRDHMEVRGIGIINVAAMFGIKSIRSNKRVDLVVSLKAWNEVPDVERLGLEQEFTQILGVKVPHITIPIRPGRDIARLIEVAAMHLKLSITGYNPAQELNERLIAQMTGTPPAK